MFQFLWDKNELVSRATCHLSYSQGGLGIPDIHVFRTLCIVKWIKNICNKEMQSIWLNYGRYWTGHALGCIKDRWKWLRNNLTPHGDPCTAPKWYKMMIEFITKHQDQLIRLSDSELTTKTLKKLTQKPHQPPCVTEWQRLVQPRLILPWSTLWVSKVGNKVKDFIWRLAHQVLPTKAYLRQWEMAVNPNCPLIRIAPSVHIVILTTHWYIVRVHNGCGGSYNAL